MASLKYLRVTVTQLSPIIIGQDGVDEVFVFLYDKCIIFFYYSHSTKSNPVQFYITSTSIKANLARTYTLNSMTCSWVFDINALVR